MFLVLGKSTWRPRHLLRAVHRQVGKRCARRKGHRTPRKAVACLPSTQGRGEQPALCRVSIQPPTAKKDASGWRSLKRMQISPIDIYQVGWSIWWHRESILSRVIVYQIRCVDQYMLYAKCTVVLIRLFVSRLGLVCTESKVVPATNC